MDHFGTSEVRHPTGKLRRFKIFDGFGDERDGRVAGQEEVQNAIFRMLGNFVRAGSINKLILLHGPNGSAKTSIVAALTRGMEDYSKLAEGALYRFNWIFPSEKLVKGSIGFGEKVSSSPEVASYAHLDADSVAVRMTCDMKDHPLFLIPRPERKKMLAELISGREGGGDDFIIS